MKNLTKTILLVAVIMLCNISQRVFAQRTNKKIDNTLIQQDKVFTQVEQMPEFPGGEDSLRMFLKNNIKYPAEAKAKKIEGMVYFTFVVDTMGKIINPKMLRGIDPLCDAEALRVISSMPAWKPGMQNNKKVPVQFNLPIKFSLGNDQDKKK